MIDARRRASILYKEASILYKEAGTSTTSDGACDPKLGGNKVSGAEYLYFDASTPETGELVLSPSKCTSRSSPTRISNSTSRSMGSSTRAARVWSSLRACPATPNFLPQLRISPAPSPSYSNDYVVVCADLSKPILYEPRFVNTGL